MSKNKKKIHITYSEHNSGVVTGSFHTLNIKVNNEETNIVLDLGMVQEGRINARQLTELNRLTVDFSNVDYVIASHSHA
jgi:metal-dependent hydrolase (beta-lactamase superfamily II)